MLKMQASFQKKVPAESNFSSQSYHCTIEVELPDGLTQQQLQEKVHGVFEFVRNSVECELQGKQPAMHQSLPAAEAPQSIGCTQQPVAAPKYYDSQMVLPPQSATQTRVSSAQPKQQSPQQTPGMASPKQRNYLLALAKRAGWGVQQLLNHCQVASVEQIPAKLCSQLIQQFSGDDQGYLIPQ